MMFLRGFLCTLVCVAAGVKGTLMFPLDNGKCRPGQQCVSVLACPDYQTHADIVRHRPRPCAFSGTTPLVCCSTVGQPVISAPLTGSRPPLPGKCGRNQIRPEIRPSVSSPLPFVPIRPAKPEMAGLRSSTDAGGRQNEPGIAGPRIQRSVSGEDSGEGLVSTIQVFGGHDAPLGKWPWVVLFGRWKDGSLGSWFCGGVLITDRHVLTAAHCLIPEEAGTVGARLGDHNLRITNEQKHQTHNISRITRHPDFVGSQNDLAVVRLATPASVTDVVSPICLPPAGAEHLDQDVDVAGWGLLEFAGSPSDVLQEAPLRVSNVADCEAAYRKTPSFETRFPGGFQNTKVCAVSRDREPRDACRGDSGGPLMAQLEDNTYQLVGIVSGGIGCGNPDFPGAYTKVSAYNDWIVVQLT